MKPQEPSVLMHTASGVHCYANKEHSGSGSRRHLIKVEEIANYQRGLVDNVSGKDIDHGAQVEAAFTAKV